MDSSLFQSAEWYHAATLAERIDAPPATTREHPVDAEAARQAFDAWRTQEPFDQESFFAQRLELDGITEDDLLDLLKESAEAMKARFGQSPPWLDTIAEAFSRTDGLSADPLPLPEKLRGAQTAGFLNIIAPVLRQALSQVRRAAERIRDERGAVPFDPATVAATLFTGLPGQLHMMLSRMLVLELNVARLEGRLSGETPEERFASFVDELAQPANAVALLREYPVLARRTANRIRKWALRSTELLQHLADDWEEIQRHGLLPAEPGIVSAIDMDAGDTHRDGRSVALVRFTTGATIVYKPRSLAVDLHFQQLLTWLNNRLSKRMPANHFRTIRVFSRADYGWVEFVQAGPCAAVEEVARFYQRQGGFLALLYVLGATDFHFENLIAAGEHPVLIDLEALFHSSAKAVMTGPPDVELVSDVILNSVLRIGLLPRRTWSDSDYEGADLSGLGGAAGQLSPDRVLRWAQMGTDEMRAERARVLMPGRNNRPALNGNAIDPLDYLDALVEGFSAVYRLLMEHRTELLSDGGPLARFADDPVRAIIRPTRFYGLLLHESAHPDLSRDGLEWEQFLDRLWVGADEAPYLAGVIPSERRDLLNDDIPVFTTTPTSRDVWDSVGNRVAEFLPQSGWQSVKRILDGMSEEDLRDQIWMIRASMATLVLESETFRWPRFTVESGPLREPRELRAQALDQARAIGDSLIRLALRKDDHLAWLGLTFSNRRWSLLPLQEDLYAGAPGVILTLAWLGRIAGQPRYEETARAAFKTLQARIDHVAPHVKSIGAFNGWGSLIYTFTHLGALWQDTTLWETAAGFVERLPPLIDDEQELDVIGGTAGCLAALLSFQKCRPSDAVTNAAIQCGEHLLATAKPMPEGIGWLTIGSATPLAGFSHGCSGIASALGELWAVTGDERYRKAAIDAVLYERSQFLPAIGNWPRPETAPAEKEDRMALSVAWCYGAPGIGLARLRLLQSIDDPILREDLAVAVETTLSEGFGTNHSLCHGALGNLDFLIQAGEFLGDPELHSRVALMTGSILDSLTRDGWLCGVPLGVESPSLLNGLAGIAYGLLRVAEPSRIPSILALDPPMAIV
jgi:type 2 lantibiotic biosynthesis protein LanM